MFSLCLSPSANALGLRVAVVGFHVYFVFQNNVGSLPAVPLRQKACVSFRHAVHQLHTAILLGLGMMDWAVFCNFYGGTQSPSKPSSDATLICNVMCGTLLDVFASFLICFSAGIR